MDSTSALENGNSRRPEKHTENNNVIPRERLSHSLRSILIQASPLAIHLTVLSLAQVRQLVSNDAEDGAGGKTVG